MGRWQISKLVSPKDTDRYVVVVRGVDAKGRKGPSLAWVFQASR